MELDVPVIKCDVLVIGTEAAGAKAAIEAHVEGVKVLAVTKGAMGRSGTTIMAGAGVQAPLGHMDPRDNPDVFLSDSVRGGVYLNNQKLLERIVNLANSEVVKLEEWGAKFRKRANGKFFQSHQPGSTYPRGLNLASGEGGPHYRKAFKSEFKRQGIVPLEDFFVTKLLLTDGQVTGAMGISLGDGQVKILHSKITILAGGGCGQLFRITDMPSTATGDTMALAFNAGAELMDMEFHQFFPYHCYGPPVIAGFPMAYLRYGLRAKLFNSRGEEFLERYMPSSKGWGLRDPTSRAIYIENLQGLGSPSGGAYLSVAHLPRNLVTNTLRNNAPRLLGKLEKVGIDLRWDALETGPAVHYTMGGVRVNESCETTLPRLLAAGENAAGMDGAERIDSGPAICWCLTMGYVAGKEAAAKARELDWAPIDGKEAALEGDRIRSFYQQKEGVKGHEIKKKIKDIMWEKCGLLRDKAGLTEGRRLIQEIREKDLPRLAVSGSSKRFSVGLVDAVEAANMVELAEMSITSALMREESRGSHCRTDFPKVNNREWLKNIIAIKGDGKAVYSTARPIMHKIEPPSDEIMEQTYG